MADSICLCRAERGIYLLLQIRALCVWLCKCSWVIVCISPTGWAEPLIGWHTFFLLPPSLGEQSLLHKQKLFKSFSYLHLIFSLSFCYATTYREDFFFFCDINHYFIFPSDNLYSSLKWWLRIRPPHRALFTLICVFTLLKGDPLWCCCLFFSFSLF